MAKSRTTVTLDERVLTAVRIRAARTGKGDSEVIEEALRDHLGLDLMERLWSGRDQGDELDENQAMTLALEAQQTVRGARRRQD